MTMQLHYFPTLNAHKVTIALEEMGLAYEVVMVDILGDEQFRPEFIAINPNGRIPALVDDDVTMFESAAILQYLDRNPENGGGLDLFPALAAWHARIAARPAVQRALAVGPVTEDMRARWLKKD